MTTKNLDKILYNLTIEAKCHKRNFEKSIFRSPEDEIHLYGMAIHTARLHLTGKWHVTEKGYLIRGFVQDLESQFATIDIDDVIPGLKVLNKIITSKGAFKQNNCKVHLHFEKGGGVMNVGIDENGLFLE